MSKRNLGLIKLGIKNAYNYEWTNNDDDGKSKNNEEETKIETNKNALTELGKSSNAGNLSNISNKSIFEIFELIPKNATMRKLTPIVGGSQVGVEYKWIDSNGVTNRLRIHDPDPSAGVRANSAQGWTARWQVGSKYYDPINKTFRPRNVHNVKSSHYDPTAANNTHTPIQKPEDWLIDLMKKNGNGTHE